MGVKLLQRVAEEVTESGVVESSPSADGRSLVMVIAPLRNKADAKADAKRAAEKKAKADIAPAETETKDSAAETAD
jgi:translation initiation factor IF-3